MPPVPPLQMPETARCVPNPREGQAWARHRRRVPRQDSPDEAGNGSARALRPHANSPRGVEPGKGPTKCKLSLSSHLRGPAGSDSALGNLGLCRADPRQPLPLKQAAPRPPVAALLLRRHAWKLLARSSAAGIVSLPSPRARRRLGTRADIPRPRRTRHASPRSGRLRSLTPRRAATTGPLLTFAGPSSRRARRRASGEEAAAGGPPPRAEVTALPRRRVALVAAGEARLHLRVGAGALRRLLLTTEIAAGGIKRPHAEDTQGARRVVPLNFFLLRGILVPHVE